MNLKKWYSGKEVKAEFNIETPDLLSLIYDGSLKAYSELFREMTPDLIKDHVVRVFPHMEVYVDTLLIPSEDVEALRKTSNTPKHPVSDNEVFPVDPETKWEDIKITLLSDEMVSIKTPHASGKFTYHQLGMQDTRIGDTYTQLWVLFRDFAKDQGFISSANNEYRANLTDTTKRLNKHLKDLFGIQKSIFKGHYKRENGYRTRILFSDRTNVL